MPLARYDRLFPNQDTVPTGSSSAGNLLCDCMPAQIRATLEVRLKFRDEDLTPAALRHAATIHNPALHEAQRSRRSTWNIPRFIQGF